MFVSYIYCQFSRVVPGSATLQRGIWSRAGARRSQEEGTGAGLTKWTSSSVYHGCGFFPERGKYEKRQGRGMADGDMELLEQMRRRRSGWGEEDFDRLYRRFGFREITRPRAPHRVYVHPEFPDLRATVGRHRSLAKGYATTAVRLVETLLARLAEREQRQDPGGRR